MDHMISYWGNPDYDAALLLIMANGTRTDDDGMRTKQVRGTSH